MIKETIDLTEHRDFSRHTSFIHFNIESRDFWNQVNADLNRRLYGKLIWRVDKEEGIPFDGIFPLGNKKQRKEIVNMYYWGTRDATVCDCCGGKITFIPWDIKSGICKKCKAEEKKEIRFPWL